MIDFQLVSESKTSFLRLLKSFDNKQDSLNVLFCPEKDADFAAVAERTKAFRCKPNEHASLYERRKRLFVMTPRDQEYLGLITDNLEFQKGAEGWFEQTASLMKSIQRKLKRPVMLSLGGPRKDKSGAVEVPDPDALFNVNYGLLLSESLMEGLPNYPNTEGGWERQLIIAHSILERGAVPLKVYNTPIKLHRRTGKELPTAGCKAAYEKMSQFLQPDFKLAMHYPTEIKEWCKRYQRKAKLLAILNLQEEPNHASNETS